MVQEGDTETRGQVIALCGNSRNSSEPHLHFHIQNGHSFNDSLGIPILFEDISKFELNKYELSDNRKLMSFEEIPSQRIIRGYAYSKSKSTEDYADLSKIRV